MRPPCQLYSLVLLICLAAATSWAQQERLATRPGAADSSSFASSSNLYTFRADVDEVEVTFLAQDDRGQPVNGLRPEDIEVLADGKIPAEIKSFKPVAGMPVKLGILLDLSDSMKPEMHIQVVTVTDALTSILRPEQDREFAVAFSNRVALVQAPTQDFAQVKRAIEHASGDHSLTSFFDAIVQTCREQFGTPPEEERRILLVFSDGLDNLSMHSLEDAADAAVRAGVTIFAIAQQDDSEEGLRTLRELTSRTGGTLQLIRKKEPPSMLLASIQGLSEGGYSVNFRPPTATPGFHTIEMRASSLPATIVRTRKSFYVQQAGGP